MQFDFTAKTASAAAKRLRAQLKRDGIEIQHAKAVEAVARVLNFENASAMRAALDANPGPAAPQIDDTAAFFDALDSVVAEATRGLQERRDMLDQGVSDPDVDIDTLADRIAAVERALPQVRAQLQAGKAPRQLPDNQQPMIQAARTPYPATPDVFVAARLAGGPDRIARIHFATLNGVRRVVGPDLDWPEQRIHQLERALSELTHPESGMSGYLLGVVREPGDSYRVIEATPVDRDRLQPVVADELSRMMRSLGLILGMEDDNWVLMDDEDPADTRSEDEKLQTLYTHAMLHDPTALRVFAFLMDNAPDYAEHLVHRLRANALARGEVHTPDSTPVEKIGLEVAHWMELTRRVNDGQNDTPRARIEIDLTDETRASEAVRVETPKGYQKMRLRPLARRADLVDLVTRGPGALRACPLGFRIVDTGASDSFAILEIAWLD